MKKAEIKTGERYMAHVSGLYVPVVVLGPHYLGGWTGRNLTTGKNIRIKSAQRLRTPATARDLTRAGVTP